MSHLKKITRKLFDTVGTVFLLLALIAITLLCVVLITSGIGYLF